MARARAVAWTGVAFAAIHVFMYGAPGTVTARRVFDHALDRAGAADSSWTDAAMRRLDARLTALAARRGEGGE